MFNELFSKFTNLFEDNSVVLNSNNTNATNNNKEHSNQSTKPVFFHSRKNETESETISKKSFSIFSPKSKNTLKNEITEENNIISLVDVQSFLNLDNISIAQKIYFNKLNNSVKQFHSVSIVNNYNFITRINNFNIQINDLLIINRSEYSLNQGIQILSFEKIKNSYPEYIETNIINLIIFIFKKYNKLISYNGIKENKHFIENDLFKIKELIEKYLLSQYKSNVVTLHKNLIQIGDISEKSFNLLIITRKLRFCFSEIKNILNKPRSILIKQNKKSKLNLILKYLETLKAKTSKMIDVFSQPLEINSIYKTYQSLWICIAYCNSKSKNTEGLEVFQSISRRLRDKLNFLKLKIREWLFFEIRMKIITPERFSLDRLKRVILQYTKIENIARLLLISKEINSASVKREIGKEINLFQIFYNEIENSLGSGFTFEFRNQINQIYNNSIESNI